VCLNTSQAAEVLVAGLLPLRDQVLVGYVLFDAVVVQLSTYGFTSVEEIIDVARFLVVNAENRPQSLGFALSLVRVCLSFFHFLIKFIQSGFNELPSFWRRFAVALDFRHSDSLRAKHCIDTIKLFFQFAQY